MAFVHEIGSMRFVERCCKTMVEHHRRRSQGEALFRQFFGQETLVTGVQYQFSDVSDAHQRYAGMFSGRKTVLFFGGNSRFRLSTAMFGGYYTAPARRWDMLWNPATVASFDSLQMTGLVESVLAGSDVLCVGYSGGGALASMVAAGIKKNQELANVALLTFGSPRTSPSWADQNGVSQGVTWVRVNGTADPVEFVVPHREETIVARDLNPSLQNHAELYSNYGLPVYPLASGVLERGDWNRQRTAPPGVLGNLIEWTTGAAEVMGRNAHMIENYAYLLGVVNLNPFTEDRLYEGERPPPSGAAQPDRERGRSDPVPKAFNNSAKDANSVYRESLLNDASGQVVSGSSALQRRPFRRLKNANGWFVSYMGLPFLHCGTKKEALKIATTMNRLLVLLDRYPDDDPATMLASLAAEIQKQEESANG